ncbi:sulfite exporter TauE/SafE family protein [Defluviitalea raffinosedens]|uniref:sulfite exporter TauE/SafE family protein n=1 Tax=Defluviitalea raffinosedens TaxID=1450156 RepID=UPI001958F0B0|nr:sulfite exporter TauE/SafE family protein [Defluviitalea raffinosedens]MBM7686950.1 putative membrane protein YfcA [Defluviitalea raffinosedens]
MILFVIGLLSGLISGMGIGGGTILIPALTIFVGMSQHSAQSINLIYFIPTAIAALVIHIRNKRIRKELLWFLIGGGVVGSVIGSFVAISLDAVLLRKLFGVFLFYMGITEIRKNKRKIKENRE